MQSWRAIAVSVRHAYMHMISTYIPDAFQPADTCWRCKKILFLVLFDGTFFFFSFFFQDSWKDSWREMQTFSSGLLSGGGSSCWCGWLMVLRRDSSLPLNPGPAVHLWCAEDLLLPTSRVPVLDDPQHASASQYFNFLLAGEEFEGFNEAQRKSVGPLGHNQNIQRFWWGFSRKQVFSVSISGARPDRRGGQWQEIKSYFSQISVIKTVYLLFPHKKHLHRNNLNPN